MTKTPEEILEALVEKEPFKFTDYGDGNRVGYCVFCDEEQDEEHLDDCPWPPFVDLVNNKSAEAVRAVTADGEPYVIKLREYDSEKHERQLFFAVRNDRSGKDDFLLVVRDKKLPRYYAKGNKVYDRNSGTDTSPPWFISAHYATNTITAVGDHQAAQEYADWLNSREEA